jgi:hypothetical protein
MPKGRVQVKGGRMESIDKHDEGMNKDFKSMSLDKYLKRLGKKMKAAKGSFWREMKLAEDAFRKEIAAAMRDYEKAQYTERKIPGALAEAGKDFDKRYETAYEDFGKLTKQALSQFQQTIEELVGA